MQLYKQTLNPSILSIAFSLYLCAYPIIENAEALNHPAYVGDIVGRDLDYVGMGWIGHVGIGAKGVPELNAIDKQFDDLSAKELNNLPVEKFFEIATIPENEETPTHINAEWRFAEDKNVVSVKRGIFIDGLGMSQERDIIPRFIEMLTTEKDEEVRYHLIRGTMIYYQNNWERVKASHDFETLKNFYRDLLKTKLSNRMSHIVIRGYINFHTSDEIEKDKVLMSKYETLLNDMEPRMALGLYFELLNKSEKFELMSVNSMINLLKKHNRSDLDGMFFGINKLAINHYKNTESVILIKNYADSVAKKYTSKKFNQDDPYAGVAAIEFNEFNKAMNKGKK